ncbi:MAG: histidine phosphatase family protein [Candidatus Hydrogenedentota bacterium]
MTLASDHTHFYLVRHGESFANVKGYVGGSTDDELTDRGHEQAIKVARHLKETAKAATALYASPLKRAWETAGHIGEAVGMNPEAIDTLVEWHAGDWEKLEYSEIPEQEGFTPEAIFDPTWAPPNGEALGDVQTRVVATLRELNTRHAGEHIIVVSHGSALALSLAELIDNNMCAWIQYKLENCSVSELILGPQPNLIAVNQTGHLLV